MSAESHEANRRILRRPEVEAQCGFKRAHLYKLIGEGMFPRPLRIGVRAVGWDSTEVEQWVAEQLQRRPNRCGRQRSQCSVLDSIDDGRWVEDNCGGVPR